MNNMAQVQKLNERELELGISAEASWHAKYKDSAWVYVGGLSTDLSEGDIICVLSQWGEIEDFNYPRDKKTGIYYNSVNFDFFKKYMERANADKR